VNPSLGKHFNNHKSTAQLAAGKKLHNNAAKVKRVDIKD